MMVFAAAPCALSSFLSNSNFEVTVRRPLGRLSSRRRILAVYARSHIMPLHLRRLGRARPEPKSLAV
jgi:hypothetical protein